MVLTPDRARKVLGVIRLVNGGVALLAPRKFLGALGEDPDSNGAAIYALRMFGTRTVYLGAQLLVAKGEVLETACRDAVFIHACDTAAAALGGITGTLKPKASVTGTLVSSFNTFLSVLARKGARSLPHDSDV